MTIKKSINPEKIINALLNIFIVIFSIILLISIYTWVQIKVFGSNYANFFGYSIFEVQTGSMKPAVNEGDWIVVKLTQDVEVGDIITYDLKGEYITHRVVGAYGGTYVTKGDYNTGKDDPIDQSQIVGKLDRVLGGFGILRKTIFNPAVLIMMIITLLLFNAAIKHGKTDQSTKEKISSYLKEIIKKAKAIFNKNNNNKPIIKTNNEFKEEISNDLNFKEDLPIETETKEVLEESFIPEINEELEPKIEVLQESTPEEQIEPLEEKKYDLEKDFASDEELSDDIDKTSLYRVIPVDLSELDETLLEIAKNEIVEHEKTKELKIITENQDFDEENLEEENDGLTKIDLELIKNSTKKNKNSIDTMINIKREEINEIFNIFIEDNQQINIATIKNIMVTTYIHAKYYNYYSEKDIEYKGRNLVTKIEKVIKLVAKELKNEYKGSDIRYELKVDICADIFKIIASLDQAKDSITDTKAKKEFFRDEIANYYREWDSEKLELVINEIIRIQKSYVEILKYFLKKLETNMFYLDSKKITSKKDWYATDLEHNLSFNKVYSDYIIDKTYTEGIIAEDKISVLFTLLMKELIQDMLVADFNKKYIIYLPNTLLKKEKKLTTLFKLVDDEYAKSHLIIVLTYKDLNQGKTAIKKFKKLGFRFALIIDNDDNLQAASRPNLHLVEWIFVNKKLENYEQIMKYIPKDLLDSIINEDLINKMNSIGVND